MQLYELAHPALNCYIRYKILSPAEVEMLVAERDSMSRDMYMKLGLEAIIHNLSEVTDSLRTLPKDAAKDVLISLYNGALMLNPGVDIELWLMLSNAKDWNEPEETITTTKKPRKKSTPMPIKKLTRAKYVNLERHLKDRIIGQDAAVDEVVVSLKRTLAGLGDENRPLGVFLFAGASGVGKTHFARVLQNYLFGEGDIVRIDCGEYQHKHESSKLIGAPPGYVGHEQGGALTNAIKKNPHTVVLLDEVEKAHPDIWNTFLRVFDEGILTDAHGESFDFRNAVIIMTTNLGNRQVVDDMTSRKLGFAADNTITAPLKSRVDRLAHEAIRKMFAPEFLNRIDKTVVFNHLIDADLAKIAELEMQTVDSKLAKKGFVLQYDEDAIDAMVRSCNASVQGARHLAQIRRDEVENKIADTILSSRFPRGTIFTLTWHDQYEISVHRPTRKRKIVEKDTLV